MLPDIPPETPAWVYVLCVGGAAVVIGIAKAGFGGGVGIIAVPLMAIALPPAQTIGVMLPVLIAGDALSLMHHRGRGSRGHLRWLLVGAAIGIVCATVVLAMLQQGGSLNSSLNLIIGGVCLGFVAVQVFRLMGGHVPRIPATAGAGRTTGFVAGFASTLTHAAGPIVSIYLLEQRLDKRLLVGTAVVFFFAANLLKVPTYLGLQLIDPGTLLQSLWVLPLVPLGTLLGYAMHQRVSDRWFTIIMYVGAAAAATHMLGRELWW